MLFWWFQRTRNSAPNIEYRVNLVKPTRSESDYPTHPIGVSATQTDRSARRADIAKLTPICIGASASATICSSSQFPHQGEVRFSSTCFYILSSLPTSERERTEKGLDHCVCRIEAWASRSQTFEQELRFGDKERKRNEWYTRGEIVEGEREGTEGMGGSPLWFNRRHRYNFRGICSTQSKHFSHL